MHTITTSALSAAASSPEATIAELRAALAALREEYAHSLVEEVLDTGRCSATDPVVLARVQTLVACATMDEEVCTGG